MSYPYFKSPRFKPFCVTAMAIRTKISPTHTNSKMWGSNLKTDGFPMPRSVEA